MPRTPTEAQILATCRTCGRLDLVLAGGFEKLDAGAGLPLFHCLLNGDLG
jgi:hypothetical protein